MAESQKDQYLSAGAESGFSFFDLVKRSRVLVLLGALLLQIALSPFFSSLPNMELLINLGLIVAAVFTVADSSKHMKRGLVLGLPGFLLLLAGNIWGIQELSWAGYFLVLLLYLFVIKLFMQKIFSAPEVTLDIIGMALCTYVLLGALWMLFYIPVAAFDPDAFRFVAEHNTGNLSPSLTYFSYVTLTTLGYGDITPLSELARSLAILEAITGTLFLAVLISRLVGSYSSSRR